MNNNSHSNNSRHSSHKRVKVRYIKDGERYNSLAIVRTIREAIDRFQPDAVLSVSVKSLWC